MRVPFIQPDPRFMFRERELARIADVLSHRQSVLLVGIRRTGKTQLMKAALRDVQAQRTPGMAVYLDVSNVINLPDFYQQLLSSMPHSVRRRMSDLLGAARTVPTRLLEWVRQHVDQAEVMGVSIDLNPPDEQTRAALPRYWESLLSVLERAVAEHDTADLPVIGLDELPFMLQNLLDRQATVEDLTVLLSSLRKLRDAGLRMLIGGSISMENLLTLQGIPHTVLGGLWREAVPPFTREEATRYMERELKDRPAAGSITLVLDGLPDLVPEFLQSASTVLRSLGDASEVPYALKQQVMPAIRRAFLQQFVERLDRHYSDNARVCAEAILDQIAQHPVSGGLLDARALPAAAWRQVLTRLYYDMYLCEGEDLGHRFTLNLLRQWWRAERGLA
jgi:hypothetical protein